MRVLVLEGGGSRTVFAHGVMCAFEEAGYCPWDLVYGNSLGGALAAWHGAGQARYARATWSTVADRRFISWRRLLLGRPMVDQERFVDTVYREEMPLDLDALARCRHEVRVVAADVDSGIAVYPDIRKNSPLAWIKATTRLPLGSNGPVQIGGRRYVDGGCLDPIPVLKAVEGGGTNVMVVLNQPPGVAQADRQWLVRRAARRYPALANGLMHRLHRKEDAWRLAANPPGDVQVKVIHPERPTGLSRLDRDLKRMMEVLDDGIAAGRAAI